MHKLFNNDYCISFLFALMRHLGASVGVLNVFWPSLRSALSGVVTVLVTLSQLPVPTAHIQMQAGRTLAAATLFRV